MNLKKIGKLFTSKFDGARPSSYKKRIYRTAVSQRLRNTTAYEDVRTYMTISRSFLFRVRNVANKFLDGIKTQILSSVTPPPPRKSCRL